MNEQENKWLTIFDPQAAIINVEKLATSRIAGNTARQYRGRLYDYLEFCGAVIKGGNTFDFSAMQLHTPHQMEKYFQYCRREGRTNSTIKAYLAPIHMYLDQLRLQHMPATGEHRFFILGVKELFEMAQRTSPPPVKPKPSFKKLTIPQAKEYLATFKHNTIAANRNAALFYLAKILLRSVADIARMRLDDAEYTDKMCQTLIMKYVEAFNHGLATGDSRRITHDTPLWQPLSRGGDKHLPYRNYSPSKGMTQTAIGASIGRMTVKGDKS